MTSQPGAIVEGDVVVGSVSELAEQGDFALYLLYVFIVGMI